MGPGTALAFAAAWASAQPAAPSAPCPYAYVGDAAREAPPPDECAFLVGLEAPFQALLDKAVSSRLLETGAVSLSREVRREDACNAYATHDKKVVLNSKSVEHLKSRRLAMLYVLAHEIGHHAQEFRHPGTYGRRTSETGNTKADVDSFSRRWEADADEIGRKLMHATGMPIEFNRLDEDWNACHGGFSVVAEGSHPSEATRWLESLAHRTELERGRAALAEQAQREAIESSGRRLRRIMTLGARAEGQRSADNDLSPRQMRDAEAAGLLEAAEARRRAQPVRHETSFVDHDEQGRLRTTGLQASAAKRTRPAPPGPAGIETLNRRGQLAISQYGRAPATMGQAVEQGVYDCLKKRWSRPWNCF